MYDLEQIAEDTGLPLADLLTMTDREINDLAWATDDENDHLLAEFGTQCAAEAETWTEDAVNPELIDERWDMGDDRPAPPPPFVWDDLDRRMGL